jgi:hypothetical protein
MAVFALVPAGGSPSNTYGGLLVVVVVVIENY